MTKTLLGILSIVALSGLTGCSKEPAPEIQAARDAVMEAEKAAANEYAPETYAQAQEQMNALTAEIEAQDGKFALFRSYDKAKEMAASTQETAARAATEAQVGKKAAMDEAMVAIQEARDALQAALTEIESAPAGKGSAADLEALKMDLAQVGQELDAIDQHLQAEEYRQATMKARAATATVGGVRAALAAATQMKGSGSR